MVQSSTIYSKLQLITMLAYLDLTSSYYERLKEGMQMTEYVDQYSHLSATKVMKTYPIYWQETCFTIKFLDKWHPIKTHLLKHFLLYRRER